MKKSPAKPVPSSPSNRELRTRKDLLRAASQLIKQGHKPSMDEIAKEALVSRATAYRYFANVEALLAEAPADAATGVLDTLFDGDTSADAEARIDKAEAAMHRVTYENEASLRVMLAHSIASRTQDGAAPVRQNRRLPLIEAALSTSRDRFRDADYKKLCAALSVIFGTESMIVFRDVLRVDEKTARKVKSWAVKALVRAAMEK
ncbi:TetR family transcriptional regulator [Roseimicrobium gellanilyticum]|uniref:TetR family transcriptional regulator n=1 Tax=Roseimicrobium gellanilyticum TaxID=748857 RepID=A0A366HUZ9_9BACT|nr:TetR/AcrR family transcriptional regulator [Roseimicrobium gellanilyticum]RBP47680.1 TetR family transcriptional regulator [Roseimicrobium gellanilyticum]